MIDVAESLTYNNRKFPANAVFAHAEFLAFRVPVGHDIKRVFVDTRQPKEAVMLAVQFHNARPTPATVALKEVSDSGVRVVGRDMAQRAHQVERRTFSFHTW